MSQIRFTRDALEDLDGLDGSGKRLVLGKLRILKRNVEAGYVLGARSTGNLTSFRCLVVGNRQYRVIYRVEHDGEVCVVWVVGHREDAACYQDAVDRLQRLGPDPTAQMLQDALDTLKPATQRAVIKIRTNVKPGEDPSR